MIYRSRNKNYRKFTCCPQRHEDEPVVHSHLAVTPAEMMKLAEKGLPISGQNLSYLPSDGEPSPSWDLPLDQIRGIDPATLWENSQIIKERARTAHINDRKRYGDNFKSKGK